MALGYTFLIFKSTAKMLIGQKLGDSLGVDIGFSDWTVNRSFPLLEKDPALKRVIYKFYDEAQRTMEFSFKLLSFLLSF